MRIKIAPNFGRFLPSQILLGRPFQKFYQSYHPCIGTSGESFLRLLWGSGSNVTKLYQATCLEAGVITCVQFLEWLPPAKFLMTKTSKIRDEFWQLSYLIANISGMDRHDENFKSLDQLRPMTIPYWQCWVVFQIQVFEIHYLKYIFIFCNLKYLYFVFRAKKSKFWQLQMDCPIDLLRSCCFYIRTILLKIYWTLPVTVFEDVTWCLKRLFAIVTPFCIL